MNAPVIRLGANDRAQVRKAVTGSPDWAAYRVANDVRIESMGSERLLQAAADLGVDLAKLLPNAPAYVPVSAPVAVAAPVAAPKPAPIVPAASAPASASDMMAQAMRMIAEASVGKVDMTQVESAIDARVEGLAESIAEVAAATVAKALASVPKMRLEVRAADGAVREVKGHKHPAFAKLARAATARTVANYAPGIWLTGPAGSGKTHAGNMLAESFGLPFHVHGATEMPHELLGFIDAAGAYHRTPFREGYEHGGVVMLDECDAYGNGALLALNAGLANGSIAFPDKVVKRHPDCIIVASANTAGMGATAEYNGRAKLDAAFLSRFPVRIAWDYDEALEIAISGNEAFARRVIRARGKAKACGLKVLIDPRQSQAGGALIAAGFTEQEAAEMTYLATLTPDQRRMIEG